jgi:hypothetical protein
MVELPLAHGHNSKREGAKLERRGRKNGLNEPRRWVYIGGLGR